jgi:GNAT superfamily N-acetyltransferase
VDADADLQIYTIDAAATHALRRRVLRAGDAHAEVRFPRDLDPGAFHLAAQRGDAVVGVASVAFAPTHWRPGRRAAQLRGMAVEPTEQGAGVGRALLDAVVERLQARGVEVLWANARDSALGFYEREGMTVVGEGFVTADTGLPHHTVVLDLRG